MKWNIIRPISTFTFGAAVTGIVMFIIGAHHNQVLTMVYLVLLVPATIGATLAFRVDWEQRAGRRRRNP